MTKNYSYEYVRLMLREIAIENNKLKLLEEQLKGLNKSQGYKLIMFTCLKAICINTVLRKYDDFEEYYHQLEYIKTRANKYDEK